MQNSKLLRYISMTILNTSATQTFPIIPINQIDSVGNTISLEFTNETTKEVITRVATTRASISDIYYLTNTNLSFLQENIFYVLKVYFTGSGVVIYKDRVFCTNQTQSSYSINNGQYLTPTIDNNSYITI
jgi:hypothetical protein